MQVEFRALARAEVRAQEGDRLGKDVAEVLANVEAMRVAVEEAGEAPSVTRDTFIRIHEALLREANPRIAGAVRDSQNWIGGNDYNPCGADFVPPAPQSVPDLLDDLATFCNDDVLPPLIQAAVAHAQFETIHPFEDGNGRTGRALVHVILRRRGLAPDYVPPISVILALNRRQYVDGLSEFRFGDPAVWFESFVVAAARAAGLAADYLQAVAALQDGWRRRLERGPNPRADAVAWSIIDALPEYPIITSRVAASATGRSRPAIDQALAQLEASGVLIPLGTPRRNKAWEASGLIEILEGLEDGRPLTS